MAWVRDFKSIEESLRSKLSAWSSKDMAITRQEGSNVKHYQAALWEVQDPVLFEFDSYKGLKVRTFQI